MGSNPTSSASKLKATLKLRRFLFRSKMANACLFYPSFIPTVSKTVRPESVAVWKTATAVTTLIAEVWEMAARSPGVVWLSLNRRKKDCVLTAEVAIGPD